MMHERLFKSGRFEYGYACAVPPSGKVNHLMWNPGRKFGPPEPAVISWEAGSDVIDAFVSERYQLIDELPEGAWVISDEPGVIWRAGRRTTDDLVDPSMLRREQGRYTAESLLQAAQDPRVCAFVAISDQRFGAFDELPAGLAAIGYDPVDTSGDGSVLFVRSDCEGSPGGS